MLSAVLRSDVAVQVSISIMKTFVEMRRFVSSNALLSERISAVELKQLQYQQQTDEKLEQIFDYISDHEESSQKIFFDGQIYDAFSLIIDLIQKAKKQIVLIDGYVDVKYTDAFHDRFMILDGTLAYHIGASLKDAGKKCFGVNILQDENMVEHILQRLDQENDA